MFEELMPLLTERVLVVTLSRVRAGRDLYQRHLSISVRQQPWREFLDPFSRNIQSSGEMGFSVAFRREGLDYRDSLFLSSFDFRSLVEIVLSILISSMLNLNHAGRESVAR